MKSIVCLSLLILWIIGGSAYSQSSSKFSVNIYTSDKGDTLRYRQLFPDSDTLRRFPLIIFLHGSGERGNDNEAQLKWGVSNFATDEMMSLYPAFVIAPQCPQNMNWSNFSRADMKLQSTPTKPMDLLIGLIHQMVKTQRID